MRPVKRDLGTWTFIPPADRMLPPAEQTTFVLKPLTQIQRMEVWDNIRWINPDGTAQPRAFIQAFQLCMSHIDDILNFPPGNPQPFPKTGGYDEKAKYLDQFGEMDLLVVGNEIRDHSGLSSDIKN